MSLASASLRLGALSAIVGATVLTPTVAAAQSPREQAQSAAATPTEARPKRLRVAFSLERAFGATAWVAESENNESELKVTGEDVSVLGVSRTDYASSNHHHAPRLAFDLVLPWHFTLGGALGYGKSHARMEEHTEARGDGNLDFGGTERFMVSPRLGYLAWLTPHVALWPRAGVSFVSEKITFGDWQETVLRRQLTEVDAELQLVLSPVEHFAFTLGVAGDLGLSGHNKIESSMTTERYAEKSSSLGIVLGLMGYL